MREKCVYVLVFKAREASDNYYFLEYWLEHVRLFGGSSPTLIVQNQVDLVPSGMKTNPPFDIASLKAKYPFIIPQCYNLSCMNADGLEPIREVLEQELGKERILNAQTPQSYYRLKELIYQQKQVSIDKSSYHKLCEQAGLAPEEIPGAVDVLDKLGIALHFPKLQELGDNWFVLDPDWLAKVVYHLLWSSQGEALEGFLQLEQLEEVFNKAKFPHAPEVPAQDLPKLLPLLDGFDLVFSLGEGRGYFAPMLATASSPELPQVLKQASSLSFAIPEGALPPALFHRFVVLSARAGETQPASIWRTGCDLQMGRARARVVFESFNKRLVFSFFGEEFACGAYSQVLRHRLIHLIGSDYPLCKELPNLS